MPVWRKWIIFVVRRIREKRWLTVTYEEAQPWTFADWFMLGILVVFFVIPLLYHLMTR